MGEERVRKLRKMLGGNSKCESEETRGETREKERSEVLDESV